MGKVVMLTAFPIFSIGAIVTMGYPLVWHYRAQGGGLP